MFKFKRLRFAIPMIAALALVACNDEDGDTPTNLPSGTIVDVAADNQDLSTLVAALTASPAIGQTDTLIVSVSKAVEVTSGQFAPFSPGALLRYEPARSIQPHPFVSGENLDVITGDVDANGEFDDAPANIDALTWNPTNRRPSWFKNIRLGTSRPYEGAPVAR